MPETGVDTLFLPTKEGKNCAKKHIVLKLCAR